MINNNLHILIWCKNHEIQILSQLFGKNINHVDSPETIKA